MNREMPPLNFNSEAGIAQDYAERGADRTRGANARLVGSGHPGGSADTFERIEVRAADGSVVATLKDGLVDTRPCAQPVEVAVLVPDRRPGEDPLVAVGWLPIDQLLDDGAVVPALGQTGQTLLVDRPTNRVVYDPQCEGGRPVAWLEGLEGERIDVASLGGEAGRFEFLEPGGVRSASFVNLTDPPWTVVTATAIDEFTVAEGRARLLWLVVVMILALAMAGGFAVLITHVMRSLDEVSTAASRIGEGDFTPWLPPPGDDEVGKLTLAIGAMVARIREMMGQLERSRQMAVVGELASHLSHEIRNPLSSIRLNLQSVEREASLGTVPADLPVVLQLCLREISRLDRVVNNVLRLGRTKPGPVRRCSLHTLIEESLEIVQPQLGHRGVRIERRLEAVADEVAADGEQLSGALLNLYLNAADAMPDGGTLRVWTERVHGADADGVEAVIRVHICDEGPGISPELREQIFRPFYTTKPYGSGIGLPLALQAAEAHRGRLYLERRSELERGAEFVLELPLAPGSSGAGAASWHAPKLTEYDAGVPAGAAL
ncbi:MAG: ATP-binding protein [Longimicrobiales bacterium]